MAVAYDVQYQDIKQKPRSTCGFVNESFITGFDLHAFNSGEHTKASEALANAEKICYVLYPGDESVEAQDTSFEATIYFMFCFSQDIVERFERRSGPNIKWEEFPEKVAVQMNDTHPTLCFPELMRILIDLKGCELEEA
ncbi:hypothetical protein GBA52_028619 [Prunus armeniaca]|nr:hypothetical protein GBA52_028619 [Prunus armeniaca]